VADVDLPIAELFDVLAERIADPDGPPRTVTLPSILVRRGTGEIPACKA
jgi:hypothetical protein